MCIAAQCLNAIFDSIISMKRSIVITLVCVLLVVMVSVYSCKTDASLAKNEYFTTVKVIAINQSTLAADTFQYVNYNETVSNPPSYVDTIKLKANTLYTIQLRLVNATRNPPYDMTDSITANADKHLMIYDLDPTSGMITVKIHDKDSKGLPLGLMSNWQTSDTTRGFLRLILRHQPGSKNGTQTPGSTDFEADYPVVVR